MLSRRFVLVLTLGLAGPLGASAQDKSMTVASTTSTQDSGLFEHILPLFKAKTGMDVKVVAQGTGQALYTPSPVLPHTGADFCHWEVSVARIYPHP